MFESSSKTRLLHISPARTVQSLTGAGRCACRMRLFCRKRFDGGGAEEPMRHELWIWGRSFQSTAGGGDQAFIWNLDSNDVTRPLLRRLRSRSSPDTGMYNTYVEVELIVCTYHSLLRSCGLVTWNGGRGGVLIRCTV